MAVDIVKNDEKGLVDRLKKLGFDGVFHNHNGLMSMVDDENAFELKVYSGKDYDFTIQKGRADVVEDLEKNGFILNKGLCHKLKENGMFVVFKFSNLIESENFFKTYKNMLINGRTCDEYSVPCIYASYADSVKTAKSPAQLIAFAEEFKYRYDNLLKSWDKLLKRS